MQINQPMNLYSSSELQNLKNSTIFSHFCKIFLILFSNKSWKKIQVINFWKSSEFKPKSSFYPKIVILFRSNFKNSVWYYSLISSFVRSLPASCCPINKKKSRARCFFNRARPIHHPDESFRRSSRYIYIGTLIFGECTRLCASV